MQRRDLRLLEHMEEYCDDIASVIEQFGREYDCFCTNHAFQYTAAFCFLQIGELAAKLSPELREVSEAEMNWRQIKGMRNIVVHDYGNVDPEIIWSVITEDIPRLKTFCIRLLSENDPETLNSEL